MHGRGTEDLAHLRGVEVPAFLARAEDRPINNAGVHREQPEPVAEGEERLGRAKNPRLAGRGKLGQAIGKGLEVAKSDLGERLLAPGAVGALNARY